MMKPSILNILAWGMGAGCVLAALLSGYVLFGRPQPNEMIWVDAVFLLAIFLGTVWLARVLARGAIGSMDRWVSGERERGR